MAKIKTICSWCGKEFIKNRKPYNPNAVFCSRECMGKHMSKLYKGSNKIKGRPRKGVYYKCDNCGKECYDCKSGYERNENHFCSVKCQKEYLVGDKHWVVKKSIYHNVKCATCGKEFTVINSQFKNGNNYCSKECAWKGQMTTIPVECEVCGKEIYKYKSAIERTNGNYCSKECYGIAKCSDEYDPEGRNVAEYRRWRKRILKRDNFTCQKCGENEDLLNVHHLQSYRDYPNLRLDISNGVTLCVDCHKKFHRLYGVYNFTSSDYYEWNKKKKVS